MPFETSVWMFSRFPNTNFFSLQLSSAVGARWKDENRKLFFNCMIIRLLHFWSGSLFFFLSPFHLSLLFECSKQLKKKVKCGKLSCHNSNGDFCCVDGLRKCLLILFSFLFFVWARIKSKTRRMTLRNRKGVCADRVFFSHAALFWLEIYLWIIEMFRWFCCDFAKMNEILGNSLIFKWDCWASIMFWRCFRELSHMKSFFVRL